MKSCFTEAYFWKFKKNFKNSSNTICDFTRTLIFLHSTRWTSWSSGNKSGFTMHGYFFLERIDSNPTLTQFFLSCCVHLYILMLVETIPWIFPKCLLIKIINIDNFQPGHRIVCLCYQTLWMEFITNTTHTACNTCVVSVKAATWNKNVCFFYEWKQMTTGNLQCC